MSQKQKHIDIIVSHLLRGDSASALRYYSENRVSFRSFNEARSLAAKLSAKAAANNGFLFPQKDTGL